MRLTLVFVKELLHDLVALDVIAAAALALKGLSVAAEFLLRARCGGGGSGVVARAVLVFVCAAKLLRCTLCHGNVPLPGLRSEIDLVQLALHSELFPCLGAQASCS